MTTIAYRARVLAADTRTGNSGSIGGKIIKIRRRDDGDMAGAAGGAAYNFAFLNWFMAGEEGPPPTAKETENSLDRGVIFRKDNIIDIYESGGHFQLEAPYYALGSGRPEALGAMHAGASAVGAVAAAAAHDPWTGDEITVLTHE